ncbi:MAG: prepilin-type N-terminal cleavage/methylation domain-containing protein [Planctomycetota bacterium]|nr:prepilin-type N-terminal cleavage/methylation domain-containing protein [Planctomycetota bacterium]
MTRARGFGLIEVLIAVSVMAVAAMAGIAFVLRDTQHSDWVRDRAFARQKAMAMLAELRSFVEGGEGEVAADLDGFDDGVAYVPSLTIQPDPVEPTAYLPAGNVVSGNIRDRGEWRWQRRITVRPFPGVATRDLRICTVQVYRVRPGDTLPGELMADVSSVIRTVGDAFPTTQVYDVFLVACENVPGWWVFMDSIQPFVEATLRDLEGRNPGLKFRTHWITKLGYGRDEEYAPYTNEARSSTDDTPWAYVYPGSMPAGNASQRYYVPERMAARMNRDGVSTPNHVGDFLSAESYTDSNGNGAYDMGEPFTDTNGDDRWDVGNEVPYALADMQNHCKRYPEALARHEARVDAGLETDDTPTWRILLDRMVAEPDRYHNALIVNLHGELLPMPPVRNISDAAAAPEQHPGWRVVTHPEHLMPRRVALGGLPAVVPRFRVHAWKAAFDGPSGAAVLMEQAEPFADLDGDGKRGAGEAFEDWNGDGQWTAGVPATLVLPGADWTRATNAVLSPSLVVERLPGGIDADGDGTADPYRAFEAATQYPEALSDTNGDGIRQVVETWFDLDGNGVKDAYDPHQELDGDGAYSATAESFVDGDGDGIFDPARPAESFVDADGDGVWDAPEPYWDRNKNGLRDGPTMELPPAWQPWNPAAYGNIGAEASYVAAYGEPFLDLDGDTIWGAGETFFDTNMNGVRDGGVERGEMWFEAVFDAAGNRSVITLHGTPLETPAVGSQGLPAGWRLYDLDYIPCPTPDSATDANRFTRDLAWSGNAPKNTARWRITLPLDSVRTVLASAPGAGDGDATDRLLAVETRIGTDLEAGTQWPTRNEPRNLSRTFAWFHADPATVPFSERYQFQGDPRHSPYADTDRSGATAPHGYNWSFDNLSNGVANAQSAWLAFDGARLRDGWKGRAGHDVARVYQWLRTAITKSEALWTSQTGFSFYYLSLGGDVGYDSANGYANSIPMDGKPFGLTTDVNENTLTTSGGTAAIIGSRKYVRENSGADAGVRAGGHWWSKPWLGELCPDSAYGAQWKPWGNLRADAGTAPATFRLIRRQESPVSQQPTGTTLIASITRTKEEGCTSFFNIGTSSATYHHQFKSGDSGSLVEDGPELSSEYNFPLPSSTQISRPFHLASSYSGGVGDEFGYTDSFPRYSAQLVRRYYNHSTAGLVGSGLIRLQEPGLDPRGGYVVVNGIDRTTESGSSFIARYSMLSLVHSYFGSGLPSSANRIRQLPRMQLLAPTLITELDNPSTIEVRWSVSWTRWDGKKYTSSYPDGFAESSDSLVYVPMVSKDNGRTWQSMLNGEAVTPGRVPWIEGVGRDPDQTLVDAVPGGDESFTWNTPADEFPQGSYLIRIEGFRLDEALHYTQHMEKIYVNR